MNYAVFIMLWDYQPEGIEPPEQLDKLVSPEDTYFHIPFPLQPPSHLAGVVIDAPSEDKACSIADEWAAETERFVVAKAHHAGVYDRHSIVKAILEPEEYFIPTWELLPPMTRNQVQRVLEFAPPNPSRTANNDVDLVEYDGQFYMDAIIRSGILLDYPDYPYDHPDRRKTGVI